MLLTLAIAIMAAQIFAYKKGEPYNTIVFLVVCVILIVVATMLVLP